MLLFILTKGDSSKLLPPRLPRRSRRLFDTRPIWYLSLQVSSRLLNADEARSYPDLDLLGPLLESRPSSNFLAFTQHLFARMQSRAIRNPVRLEGLREAGKEVACEGGRWESGREQDRVLPLGVDAGDLTRRGVDLDGAAKDRGDVGRVGGDDCISGGLENDEGGGSDIRPK